MTFTHPPRRDHRPARPQRLRQDDGAVGPRGVPARGRPAPCSSTARTRGRTSACWPARAWSGRAATCSTTSRSRRPSRFLADRRPHFDRDARGRAARPVRARPDPAAAPALARQAVGVRRRRRRRHAAPRSRSSTRCTSAWTHRRGTRSTTPCSPTGSSTRARSSCRATSSARSSGCSRTSSCSTAGAVLASPTPTPCAPSGLTVTGPADDRRGVRRRTATSSPASSWAAPRRRPSSAPRPTTRDRARAAGLELGAVALQDLFVHLTDRATTTRGRPQEPDDASTVPAPPTPAHASAGRPRWLLHRPPLLGAWFWGDRGRRRRPWRPSSSSTGGPVSTASSPSPGRAPSGSRSRCSSAVTAAYLPGARRRRPHAPDALARARSSRPSVTGVGLRRRVRASLLLIERAVFGALGWRWRVIDDLSAVAAPRSRRSSVASCLTFVVAVRLAGLLVGIDLPAGRRLVGRRSRCPSRPARSSSSRRCSPPDAGPFATGRVVRRRAARRWSATVGEPS